MTSKKRICGALMMCVLVTLLPSRVAAQAQSSATVAGVVRDTTGGSLPGVTVAASSPVLIEKVRIGVTDDRGQYQIVNLVPGVYTITFTLPGFASLKRDSVALQAGFTANVAVELSVGSVEESITVTGESPLVDTRSTSRNEAFTRDEIDALPTAKHFANLASLIPGMRVTSAVSSPNTQDVGGTLGDPQFGVAKRGLIARGAAAAALALIFPPAAIAAKIRTQRSFHTSATASKERGTPSQPPPREG